MKKVIGLLLVLLTLSSCGYGEDIDKQAFVIAVGVEEGTQYNLRTTFVFANPSSQGGEEGKSKDSEKSEDIVTIEAPTIHSAIRRLNSVKSKKINMTHTKIIVLSEELAKKGVKSLIDGFVSARDFRPNTFVCVSVGSADEYLRSVKPKQEAFVEKYYDHMMRKVVTDSVNEAYLYYLYFNMEDGSCASIVPLVGKNEDDFPKEKTKETIYDDFAINEYAGQIAEKAENKAEITGSAIFNSDRMIGKIGSLYTDIARFIGGEFYPDNYSITNPSTNEYVTVRLLQNSKPTVKTNINGHKPTVQIKIPISIEYIAPSGIETKEESDSFLNYMCIQLENKAKELINYTQQGEGADFLGIGEAVKKHFLDINSWQSFNWRQKYKNAEIDVDFEVKTINFEETR
ncbi:MAG: Ger(x)C family spore germination protein [Clostridia bacterium]|nr:Ger(x)C family spore germination protein [Clostridia bacterium]